MYTVYMLTYLEIICNGLMRERDMYFVDTKT